MNFYLAAPNPIEMFFLYYLHAVNCFIWLPARSGFHEQTCHTARHMNNIWYICIYETLQGSRGLSSGIHDLSSSQTKRLVMAMYQWCLQMAAY